MSTGNPVDAAWLEARGFLHDARATTAELVDRTVHLGLDDEWADAPRERTSAGTLIIEDVGLWAGDVATWKGGRVDKIGFEGPRLAIRFIDRGEAVIEVGRVLWEPS